METQSPLHESVRAGAIPVAVDLGLRAYMLRVYNYMAGGLALTGAVAYVGAVSGFFASIAGTPILWIVLLAPLAMVFFLSFRIQTIGLIDAATRRGPAHARLLNERRCILKSQKGARKIEGRAPRKRGGKAKTPGMSTKTHDAIMIVRDRHGATSDAVLPDLSGSSFAAVLKPIVASDAMLVSDGRAAYGQFADAAGILHISLNASTGQRSYLTYHIQNVNACTSRLKGWLRPFKGVASKYLTSYLGWHRMLDCQDAPITAAACLAAALG